ncbi:uncharacterized protein LOC132948368 [Metopolophium dirhodum]|uniref:uncharacterized protein LOC132948368 n=1 Tax=Metopolophium dirhodum TaxID=44670 RepID=UPI00298FD0C7|nr:uncharacterized protein LOC132948368 [Metopolophium dirhodum]
MSNIVAPETSPKSMIQSVTDNYFEVFDVLQPNRAKTLESRDIKSSQAHGRYKSTPNVALHKNSAGADEPETRWPIMRRYKSMPNMAVQRTNFADESDDVPDYIELPSIASMVELQVSTDLSSTELSVTAAPATAEVDEIEAPSNISSSLPRHVRPIEADVLQSSPTYNTAALQFHGDESINCSAKPSVHQANGIQDMVVTRGGCSDAATNPTVTAVILKRRSL